jgi:hypothetical protein
VLQQAAEIRDLTEQQLRTQHQMAALKALNNATQVALRRPSEPILARFGASSLVPERCAIARGQVARTWIDPSPV